MSALKCPACGWVGNEPERHRELEKVDEGAAFYVVVEECTDCGNDELVEVELCQDCKDGGADVEATDGEFCKSCAALNEEPFKRDQVGAVEPLVREA